MKILAVFLIFFAATLAQLTDYAGYKVFHIMPRCEQEIKVLKSFDYQKKFDFWNEPRETGLPISIMVSADLQKTFIDILNLNKLHYTIMIHDVKQAIEAEQQRQSAVSAVPKGEISFNKYHQYNVIEDYLFQLMGDYPEKVSLETIAFSHYRREIIMIKIGTGGANKPIIFIEGGMFGRSWISTAFSLYVIQQLVENEDNRALIESADWYIVPVVNPDGYEFTHTTQRLWRKTLTPGDKCDGVDGNRNFDYNWRPPANLYEECSNTYPGIYAFSAYESAAIRDAVLKYKNNIKLYLAIHSYDKNIVYPWGWTSEPSDNAEALDKLASNVAAAIGSVNGTSYTVSASKNLFDTSAGSSADWAKGVAGIDKSFTVELPGGGLWGFDVPPSEILGVCKETWEGLLAFTEFINKNRMT